MAHSIIKVEGKYLIWSTVVDAPITYGMTREQLEKYWRDEYGRRGMEDLAERIGRADEKGTSAWADDDAFETIRMLGANNHWDDPVLMEIHELDDEERDDPKWDEVRLNWIKANRVNAPVS